MDSALTAQLGESYGGQMSDAQLTFCHQVRELMQKVIEERIPFVIAAMALWADLAKIRQDGDGDELELARSRGRLGTVEEALTPLSDLEPIPQLSQYDREFVEDVDGFMDFAVRNGLGFRSILFVLFHDFDQIRQSEWSLEKAKRGFFFPKTDGWAKKNAEPIGEPDEFVG